MRFKLFEEYNIDDELTIGNVLYREGVSNDVEIIIDYDENYVWRVDTKYDVWKTKTGVILGNIGFVGDTKLIDIVDFLKDNSKYIPFVKTLYELGEQKHGDFYTLYDEWEDNEELKMLFETKKFNL